MLLADQCCKIDKLCEVNLSYIQKFPDFPNIILHGKYVNVTPKNKQPKEEKKKKPTQFYKLERRKSCLCITSLPISCQVPGHDVCISHVIFLFIPNFHILFSLHYVIFFVFHSLCRCTQNTQIICLSCLSRYRRIMINTEMQKQP